MEIGCDGDTTQGSEPTHARSATDVDFDRGYEVWLMEEAVKRRADMQLSGYFPRIPWIFSRKCGKNVLDFFPVFRDFSIEKSGIVWKSGLEWGIPGWVAADGMWSKTNVGSKIHHLKYTIPRF